MNLIFTLAMGSDYKKIAKITHPTIKAYANKIGAEFIALTEDDFQINSNRPHWCKLQAFRTLLDKYDKVLYIDTDIIIRPDAPSLFDIVGNQFAVFKESQFTERAVAFTEYLSSIGYPLIKEWKGDYYNTGVILANKDHAKIFQDPGAYRDHFYEQSYLNANIDFLKPKIHNLNYKFNRMTCMDQITGEERYDSYFIHYAGQIQIGVDNLCQLITNDLRVWSDTPDYKFKRNVAVIVEGGMGDQIAAEPTLRYIKEVVYKGDNIIAVSDWPELFGHLDIPVYHPKDQIPNHMSYHQLRTLRSPEHESWNFMSHPLIHCVDFASQQALRLQIPKAYKQPQLRVDIEDVKKLYDNLGDLNNCVLVHPGRGWNSKTFPVDVWQSYIDGLIEAGKKVILIGKRVSEEQGIVEVDGSKCLDLIDKLSVKELVAIISQVPILLTNDSAPVHIAGAFNNHICLISTCKNPEYILHYRNGSQDYKAKSLEIDTMYNDYNSQPTQVYGEKIDKCTEERMRMCLPSKQRVISYIAGLE